MKNLLTFFFFLSLWSCGDDPDMPEQMGDLDPADLTSCFSPEFGITEDEQFFYDIVIGELQVDLTPAINSNNVGYSIEEGTDIVFVYRHFLENNFTIIDDEVENRILFQIDGDLDSFSISSDEEFENLNCIYTGCSQLIQPISSSVNGQITGIIDGQKLSNGNWNIDADLRIDRSRFTIEVQINETFVF